MRLRSLLLSLIVAALGGCGNDGTAGTPAPPHPPPPPKNAAPGDGSAPLVISVSKLFIGTADRAGNVSPSDAFASAWEGYGFDLDNQETTTFPVRKNLLNHCLPAAGGSPSVSFPDGYNGIDNAFGHNILPILRNAMGSVDYQSTVNEPIVSNESTLLIALPGLGRATSENPVSSFVMLGEKFDGSAWQLVPNSLTGTTPDSATCSLPSSYVANDVWVSGGDATLVVPIAFLGSDIRLTIHHVVMDMTLSSDRRNATNGTIAGILDTEELVSEFHRLAGTWQTSLCTGAAINSILTQIRQASDILSDGTQDPTKTCDGISIGLGFEGKATAIGGVGPALSFPDPCTAGG